MLKNFNIDIFFNVITKFSFQYFQFFKRPHTIIQMYRKMKFFIEIFNKFLITIDID